MTAPAASVPPAAPSGDVVAGVDWRPIAIVALGLVVLYLLTRAKPAEAAKPAEPAKPAETE